VEFGQVSSWKMNRLRHLTLLATVSVTGAMVVVASGLTEASASTASPAYACDFPFGTYAVATTVNTGWADGAPLTDNTLPSTDIDESITLPGAVVDYLNSVGATSIDGSFALDGEFDATAGNTALPLRATFYGASVPSSGSLGADADIYR